MIFNFLSIQIPFTKHPAPFLPPIFSVAFEMFPLASTSSLFSTACLRARIFPFPLYSLSLLFWSHKVQIGKSTNHSLEIVCKTRRVDFNNNCYPFIHLISGKSGSKKTRVKFVKVARRIDSNKRTPEK